jgi:hypothetical protein
MAEAYTTNPVHDLPLQQPHTHERTDIATRPLWIFVGVFLVISVIIQVGLYILFFAYERTETELDKNRTRSLVKQTDAGPAEPRLQGIPGFHLNTPREDAHRMRLEDAERLNSYGPEHEGVAKIPIGRAMDLLLERGLPVQTQPSTRPVTQAATTTTGGANVP